MNPLNRFFETLALPFYLVWTGIKPGKDDPKTWYDRTIRIVGGAMLIAVFIAMTIYEVVSRH